MIPFKLSKPIVTHNGEVTELTVNEPSARPFIKYGEPFKGRWVPRPTEKDPDAEEYDITYDNNAVFMKFLADMIEPKIDDMLLQNISASDFRVLRTLATRVLLGMATGNPT